jgi:hypothetical protein
MCQILTSEQDSRGNFFSYPFKSDSSPCSTDPQDWHGFYACTHLSSPFFVGSFPAFLFDANQKKQKLKCVLPQCRPHPPEQVVKNKTGLFLLFSSPLELPLRGMLG